jgi:hypothetical protein
VDLPAAIEGNTIEGNSTGSDEMIFGAFVFFTETRGIDSFTGTFTRLDSSESTKEAQGGIHVETFGAIKTSSTSLLCDERGFRPIKLLGVTLSPWPPVSARMLKSKVAELVDSPLEPILCMLYVLPVTLEKALATRLTKFASLNLRGGAIVVKVVLE